VSALLLELSVAVHRRSMYPSDHPAIEPAVDSLTRRAGGLLRQRPTLPIRVVDQRLVVDDVAADDRVPLIRALAERLNRHEIGGLVLAAGIEPWEVGALLEVLGTDPERSGTPAGAVGKGTAWPHIRLLRAPLDGPGFGTAAYSEATGGLETVWLELARAAGASTTTPGETTAAAIAGTLGAAGHDRAHHRAALTALLGVVAEARQLRDHTDMPLREQASAVLASMPGDNLARLLAEGGDARQRQRLVLDAAGSLSAEATFRAFCAAADAPGWRVPDPVTQLLHVLVERTGHGSERARARADASLREQIVGRAREWTAVEHAADDPDDAPLLDTSIRHASSLTPEPLRVVATCIEIGALCEALPAAVDAVLHARQHEPLLDLLTHAPRTSAATAVTWRRCLTPQTVQQLLTPPIDWRALDRILPLLRGEAIKPLFDLVATSENRAVRRMVLDRLARLGPTAAQEAIRRLDDDRWFVVRNMLALLADLPELPPAFRPSAWLAHADARVRREALRVLLRIPATREPAIRDVLARDSDTGVLWLALGSLRQGCSETMVDPLIGFIRDASAPKNLRLLAVRVLAHCRAPAALNFLLETCFDARALGDEEASARLRVESARALASGWADDPRTQVALTHLPARLRRKAATGAGSVSGAA
jgi:hypothetical protein